MKIGILNSGGDVQALNAVISAAVKRGIYLGHEFIGFRKGWEGILTPVMYQPLTLQDVRGISHQGGTILHTVNRGRFAGRKGEGDVNKIPDNILEDAKNNLKKLGIDVLIAIGGDGGMAAAAQLAEKGVKIIGLPKTIDNDLASTDKTFGFSTAVDIVLESLDRIHTTATSHDRVILVETMGRNAGWIALYSGLAGGADMILIPEIPFNYDKIINFLRKRKETGYRSSVVVVAEGAKAQGEEVSTLDSNGGKPEVRLGGISEHLTAKIDELAPGEFELRNVVLGHVQRGGSPNAEDRTLAKEYGVAAIDAIEEGKFNCLVSLRGEKMITVPLKDVLGDLKIVTKNSIEYQTAKKIGIYFGNGDKEVQAK